MTFTEEDKPKHEERMSQEKGKVIIFTCNWQAYNGLENACRDHITLPPNVYTLKVMCLGQLSPGIILKALEKGAEGILLLGCPPGECHFEFGNRRSEEVYREVKELTTLLGYRGNQIKLDWVPVGGGDVFMNKVLNFINALSIQEAP